MSRRKRSMRVSHEVRFSGNFYYIGGDLRHDDGGAVPGEERSSSQIAVA